MTACRSELRNSVTIGSSFGFDQTDRYPSAVVKLCFNIERENGVPNQVRKKLDLRQIVKEKGTDRTHRKFTASEADALRPYASSIFTSWFFHRPSRHPTTGPCISNIVGRLLSKEEV